MNISDGTTKYSVIQVNGSDFQRLNFGPLSSIEPVTANGTLYGSYVFRDNSQKTSPCVFLAPAIGTVGIPAPEIKKIGALGEIILPESFGQIGFSFPMEDRINLLSDRAIFNTRGGIAVINKKDGAWSWNPFMLGGSWQTIAVNSNEILAGNPWQDGWNSETNSSSNRVGSLCSMSLDGQNKTCEQGSNDLDQLGDGLGMNDTWKFVGKASSTPNQAEVRAYKKSEGKWNLHQTLKEDDAKFGSVIRLNKEALVITGWDAFLYRYDSVSDQWVKLQRMTSPDPVMDISDSYFAQRSKSGKTHAVRIYSLNLESKQYELADTLIFPALGVISSIRLVGNKLAVAGGEFESAAVLLFESESVGKFTLKKRFAPPISAQKESCFGMGLDLNETEIITSDNCYGDVGKSDMLYHGTL